MIRFLTIIFASLTLTLSPLTGRGQSIDAEARAGIAAINERLDKAGIPKLPATQPTIPTTKPVDNTIPPPTPTRVTAKPVALPPIVKTIAVNVDVEHLAQADVPGTRYALGKSGRYTLWAGQRLSNAVIQTTPGITQGAVFLHERGTGAVLENIQFADGGGFLIEAKGTNQVIRNVSAQNVTNYVLFCTDATGILIDGFYFRGASKDQSCIRFGSDKLQFSSGVLRDFVIDWTANTGSAALRGNFVGVVENGLIRNRVVGLNPQFNDDEGMADGIYVFTVNGMPTRAKNTAQCLAAYKGARGRGIVDPLQLSRAALAVADLGGGVGDAAQSLALRKKRLARRSDVIFRYVTFENATLQWAAGTKYDVRNCTLSGNNLIANVGPTYPTDELFVPGDVRRSPADVTFTDCTFISPGRSMADFLAQVRALGVKLRGNNTLNGQPLGAVGMFIGPADDTYQIERAA